MPRSQTASLAQASAFVAKSLRIQELFSSPLSTGENHNILWLKMYGELRLDRIAARSHEWTHVAAATELDVTRPVLLRIGRKQLWAWRVLKNSRATGFHCHSNTLPKQVLALAERTC
jgi:hypothetical protein